MARWFEWKLPPELNLRRHPLTGEPMLPLATWYMRDFNEAAFVTPNCVRVWCSLAEEGWSLVSFEGDAIKIIAENSEQNFTALKRRIRYLRPRVDMMFRLSEGREIASMLESS